jgi:hypothetical protein
VQHLALEFLEQVLVIAVGLQQLPQRGNGPVQGLIFAPALLVTPVGGHPEFRELVHRPGPDLDFDHFALGSDDRGVQGLIAIVLGVGDVVVELARKMRPVVVDDAQHRVAGGKLINDDSGRAQVGEFLECELLLLHLVPDAVDVLRAAVDAGLHALGLDGLLQLAGEGVDVVFARAPVGVEPAGDGPVGIRLEDAQRQVLHLPLQRADAKPIGERRQYIERLLGEKSRVGFLPLRCQAQVLQPERELDQHRADVVHHGQQHPAQPFGLFRAVGRGFEPPTDEFADVLGEARDHVAELLAHLVVRQAVGKDGGDQQCGDQGLAVDVQPPEDLGHVERMGLKSRLFNRVQRIGDCSGQLDVRGIRARKVPGQRAAFHPL